MPSCCLILLAAMWSLMATVSGHILDQEGNPVAGATVTYRYIGIVEKSISSMPSMRTETSRMVERSGRNYTIKTDKKGSFTIVGVDYGVYQIDITAADGRHIYSGKKNIGEPSDPNSQNVLNVDLSTGYGGPQEPGSGTNLAAGKKSKEQLNLIREENAHAAKINHLVVRYHAQLDLEDWPGAMSTLKELITLDTQRWEFYQNLGTLQLNQMEYQNAAQNFAQAVKVAEKVLANPTDTDRALTIIAGLLLAEADSYEKLGQVDEAVSLYDQAAARHPHPYMAHYRACNVLNNNGQPDAAIAHCNLAVADDPTQWEPYQLMGGVYSVKNQPQDALAEYEKGIAAAQKMLELEKQPDSSRARIGLGQMLNAQGNLLIKQKKYDEAIAAFTQAVESAAYPAMPYFNLCATYYNLKRNQEALAACDHAIASDPRLADAYYIKASILFGQGQNEHGKYVVPPGTTEALNKYLENAPDGDHAAAVKEMINQLNRPLATTYSQPKK